MAISPPLPTVSQKRRRAGCATALLIFIVTPLISTLLFQHPRGEPAAPFLDAAGEWGWSEGRWSCFVAGAPDRLDQRLDARLAGIVFNLDLAGIEAHSCLLDARQGI